MLFYPPLAGEKTEVQGSEGLSQVPLYNDPILLANTLQGALMFMILYKNSL